MNCAHHPELAATAYCRSCGKPLCTACQRTMAGTIVCEEHYIAQSAPPPEPPPPPPQQAYSPYTTPYTAAPPGSGPSPGLAFILGLIPGVGAIYNGQYAKGLIHVVILGTLISILSSGAAAGSGGGLEPLFAMLAGLWCIYMPFEAYHTASKRLRGEPVDEFSSVVPMRYPSAGFPLAPIILIGIGVVFLLNNLEIVRLYQIFRFWPAFLILLGVYMLYARVAPGGADHER